MFLLFNISDKKMAKKNLIFTLNLIILLIKKKKLNIQKYLYVLMVYYISIKSMYNMFIYEYLSIYIYTYQHIYIITFPPRLPSSLN